VSVEACTVRGVEQVFDAVPRAVTSTPTVPGDRQAGSSECEEDGMRRYDDPVEVRRKMDPEQGPGPTAAGSSSAARIEG
jgi:hypothetical protein